MTNGSGPTGHSHCFSAQHARSGFQELLANRWEAVERCCPTTGITLASFEFKSKAPSFDLLLLLHCPGALECRTGICLFLRQSALESGSRRDGERHELERVALLAAGVTREGERHELE
jgi:hypothetical protein